MKNRLFSRTLLCMPAAVCLAGCGSSRQEVPEPQAVALLLGNHACSKGLNLNSPRVTGTVTDAVMSYGFVSVVSVDGDPEVLLGSLYEIPEQYRDANPAKLRADAREKAASLLGELSQVAAKAPQVGVLQALHLAVRSFAGLDPDMQKTILVVDTGLSTTGLLDFRQNLISAPPEGIAGALAERGAIPDFTGIQVVWQQLGDVDLPQQPLSPKQRRQMAAIWKAIVEKGGGTFVWEEALPNPPDTDYSCPAVSPVDLPADMPVRYAPPQGDAAAFLEPTVLTEQQVQFIGDSADYLSPGTAAEVLAPVAQYLAAHPETQLLLIGTTAGDENSDFARQLSMQRAQAVKSTLVSLGADGENLLAVGLGSADPWHIYGVGTQGELASANRKVVLLDANAELAREVLAQ